MRLLACDFCIHLRGGELGELICDAFPDGAPIEIYRVDASELKECGNGIHYEPRPDDDWATAWNPKEQPTRMGLRRGENGEIYA